MTDADLNAKIRVAQAAAVEQVRIRHGKTHADVAAALAPRKADPLPDLADAWQQRGAQMMRSVGMKPVTDEEAVKIKMQVEQRMGEKDGQRARELDDALINFRRERDIGRVTGPKLHPLTGEVVEPAHMYYVDPLAPMETVMNAATGKMVAISRRAAMDARLEKIEEDLIHARLQAGLPAEPAPRPTPTQRAEARYNAERTGDSR